MLAVMEFELDQTYGIEFARLEPHEQQLAREHIGPQFPVSVEVKEINIFEDAFRRKARQATTALDALRESHQLGSRSDEAFVLRGVASILESSLADIRRYREENRRRAFAELGEEEPSPPDNAS